MNFATNTTALWQTGQRHARPLLLAIMLLLACLGSGCADTHPIPDDGGGFNPGGSTKPLTPIGQWQSTAAGNFDILKASGIDHFTLVFKDPLRPRLDVRAEGIQQFTARGTQTNAAQREVLEYTMNGSFNTGALNATLTIVKRRTGTNAVFSTQIVKIVALKQRHETF